VKKER
jgi:hypothetical protein